MLKVGDKVRVKQISSTRSSWAPANAGREATITRIDNNNGDPYAYLDILQTTQAIYLADLEPLTPVGVSMLKSISSDIKGFVTEHKQSIYTVALLLILDQVFFQGAFREKLHGLMNKMLGKVESALDSKKDVVALVPEKKA